MTDMNQTLVKTLRYYASQPFADISNETVRVKALLLKVAAEAIDRLNAAPQESLKPVAWRHRHRGSIRWIYTDDEPTGPSIHLFDVEPLCSLTSQLSRTGE